MQICNWDLKEVLPANKRLGSASSRECLDVPAILTAADWALQKACNHLNFGLERKREKGCVVGSVENADFKLAERNFQIKSAHRYRLGFN